MYIYLFNLINPIHTPEKIFCYAAGHNTAKTGQIGRGDPVPLFQNNLKIHPPPSKSNKEHTKQSNWEGSFIF